ncbi:hypothetical protein JZ785_14580 [Alicyclobacillus curvatus]|nr:hypothetical protein JZ785_14580 [Alicyclobacillus curvatus]
MRVLLFTAHFGDGHRQVATALRSAFEAQGVEVEEIDCMRNAHPKYARMNEASFELTTKYAPYIYGLSYTLTRTLRNNSWLWKLMSTGGHRTAEEAVLEFAPDAVLQLFPEHTLNHLAETFASSRFPSHIKRPVSGVVLTDFSVHSRWFCPNSDVYYMPHDSFLDDARKVVHTKGKADFVVSGIPLRTQFRSEAADARVDTEVLDDVSGVSAKSGHILVATGGRGVFGGLKDVLTTLYDRREGRDVVVMCGRNTAMHRLVSELALSRPGLKALPFVENVALWLRSAAFAVVKPGGVTVAECLASGCPMLFYRPPLGQELDNARWVTKHGAGRMASNLKELSQAASWLSQSDNIKTAVASAQSLGRADAAFLVAQDVIRRVKASLKPAT